MRAKARRGHFVIERGKGLRPFPRTPILARDRLPPLRSGYHRLTKPNTFPTIVRPASLRSERVRFRSGLRVRHHPGIAARLRRNPHRPLGADLKGVDEP